ncbi:class I SAM-dependent methyltransferase [Streptomyces sp. NBC_01537]|uniref:class I SAM-dependent methyltransferase n=1 Tax=Streptomyces sp. NBC_01537 TaxID=2903896 RepID=UPI003866EA1C
MKRDTYADRFLSGQELWGDDFTDEQIQEWFADEREAYADLGSAEPRTPYGYNGINSFLGFRTLPRRRFSHALGVGSSFGEEFLPILHAVDRITILEPSDRLRSTNLQGFPLEYVKPVPSGEMPFEAGAFDLVLCLGVLHHVPNVSRVVGEIGRVLAPGGWVVLREPVVSMGDWRSPRKPGLTLRERGIPRHIFETAVDQAGLSIRSSVFCMSPMTSRIGRAVRRNLYATQTGAFVDRTLAVTTAWNYRYHATRAWQKIRPTNVFITAERRGD